jgi:hypothetical protein
MLFHVTHTHGYDTCMAHDEKGKTKLSQTISNAVESGVKVNGVYADPPGHQIFMVVETDTMEQLVKFLDPIIDFGDYEIRPVLNLVTAIENLSNN